MANHTFLKQVSKTLRRMPWLHASAYILWRLSQPKYSIGAVGVIIDDEGKVLLVEHAFHPKHPWGLPGGWVNAKEDPAITVQRECLEELSLVVEVGPILLVDSPYPNHLDLAYLCRTKGTVGTLSYELLDFGWFNADDLPGVGVFTYRAVRRALELVQVTEYTKWLQD